MTKKTPMGTSQPNLSLEMEGKRCVKKTEASALGLAVGKDLPMQPLCYGGQLVDDLVVVYADEGCYYQNYCEDDVVFWRAASDRR